MQDGSLPGGGSGSGGGGGGSGSGSGGGTGGGGTKPNEKALLARIWGDFDTKYMKPLLTHSRPTLLETLPVCCSPLARILTTTQQMTQVRNCSSEVTRAGCTPCYHPRRILSSMSSI